MPELPPIAIVAGGCVLPGARNCEAFWELLRTGTPQFSPIPLERWDIAMLDSRLPGEVLPITQAVAAQVGPEILNPLRAELDPEGRSTRQELCLFAATQQTLAQLRTPSLRRRSEVILGMMSAGEEYYHAHFQRQWGRSGGKDLSSDRRIALQELFAHFSTSHPMLPTALLAKLRTRFGINGNAYFVNAACGSSLAALQIAVDRLRSGAVDMVLSGGTEPDLEPGAFIAFSILNAMSKTTCRPFDVAHDGLLMGEGAVVLALQRLEDALADGHQILGVVRGFGAASDGRGTSVFAPTVRGQVLAYQRAYQGLESPRVDYIEAHGTGTVLGDQTELQSLGDFFGLFRIPIGSVKALLGHTKGAAGAVGVLKALLILKHKEICPSPYFSNLSSRAGKALFVNARSLKLRERETPYRVGISSFGFGGANFHMVIDEFKEPPARIAPCAPAPQLVVLAAAIATAADADLVHVVERFRIPQETLARMDMVQRQALVAVQNILNSRGLRARLREHVVGVVSATGFGLDLHLEVDARLKAAELINRAPPDRDVIAALERIRRKGYLEPTEDTIPGSLNNVIAGRVANAFDFTGGNYNIDGDLASLPCALAAVQAQFHTGVERLVFLLWTEQQVDPEPAPLIKHGALHAWLVCRRDFAVAQNFSPLGEVTLHAEDEPS